MGAPIVYRWDDGNAPVCRGERRSLHDILYACLVTGYGSKPAAGWTREFVNATFDKAVFRNNPLTGTGFFLQVDGATPAYSYTPAIRGYEVMTSENDGLGPFSASACYCFVSNTGNTTAHPWVLIADDRHFYFVSFYDAAISPAPTGVKNVSGVAFGDGVRIDGNDAFFCCLSGAIAAGQIVCFGQVGSPVTAPSSAGHQLWASPRSMGGTVGPRYQVLVRGGGPGTDPGPNYYGAVGVYGSAWSAGKPIYLTRPYISDVTAYSFRGWAPGLYYPCHNGGFNQLQTVTVDGRNYLSLLVNYSGNFFISLDDWRV